MPRHTSTTTGNRNDASPTAHVSKEEFDERVKNLKNMGDVSTFLKDMLAPTIQTMLEEEMNQHLGYEKHDPAGNNSGNSRNGHSKKTLKTSFGEQEITVPRARNGDYDPVAVKKYETVESDIEERIVSMYAKGMTTRDINAHMGDIYGVSVSADMVSSITDKVLPLIEEWQSRPLARQYVLVYMDGLHFKVRDNGRIVTKCAYVMLGVTPEGMKEVIGIWIGEAEGAKFWMQVLTDIRNRGVEDILFCCVDGLTGFVEAIASAFPDAVVQRCIVHQIRNSTKYIPHKHRKAFCADLKRIYEAPNEESAMQALLSMQEAWPQYAVYLKSWEKNWQELSPFFSYPEEIRRLIYTTNAIESLNRQFRKVTKSTTIFPGDEALTKLLWLAQRDSTKKWKRPLRDWGTILAQLAILFPNRVTIS